MFDYYYHNHPEFMGHFFWIYFILNYLFIPGPHGRPVVPTLAGMKLGNPAASIVFVSIYVVYVFSIFMKRNIDTTFSLILLMEIIKCTFYPNNRAYLFRPCSPFLNPPLWCLRLQETG